MERRRKEDFTEPQTIDELVRAIYRNQKDVIDCLDSVKKTVYGNGKPGLCDRMITLETIVKVISWVVGIGVPSLGVLVSWIVFFKR